MTNIGINHYNTNLKVAQPQNVQAKEAEATKEATAAVPAENKHVELSAKAKELSAAEASKVVKPEEETSKVESFAHGVLGMDHPEKGKEEVDDSYSAGQFLKGALSVGALLLAIV